MVKILLAGHTGLHKIGKNKDGAAYRLKAALEDLRPEWVNRVSVVDLEECIEKTHGGEIAYFAGNLNVKEQRARWTHGWQRAMEILYAEAPHCAIVSLHLVLASYGYRSAPVELADVAGWCPDFVITLIDDIYSVKRRIALKGFDFSVSQLYDWRSSELVLADQVARLAYHLCEEDHHNVRASSSPSGSLRQESFLIATKTPALSLARMVAQPELPRVYASFTMGDTRGSASDREEINAFRRQLHELFPVFDPITIEEVPLLAIARHGEPKLFYHPDLNRNGRPKEEIDRRWDCRIGDGNYAPLVWEPETAKDAEGNEVPFFPVAIRRAEFEELFYGSANLVDEHVTSRDLRLVDQADLLVSYRPFWKGKITTGVGREIVQANQAGKPTYAYVGDDNPDAGALRGRITRRFTDLRQFWDFLANLKQTDFREVRQAYC